MLRIRLRRMGSRHRPFYRVVVSDSHRVPRASALEEVGYYDPRKTPATLSMNVERVDYWMSHGAQPSNTVKKLVARARAAAPADAAAESEAATEAEAAAETEATEAAAETAEAADGTEAADSAEAAAEGGDEGAEAEASAEEAADGEATDKAEESESA